MTTAAQLLTDIDVRYRNPFTVAQKCVWMNDEQNDIFTQFKIDIGPVNFPLIDGVHFYPLPYQVESESQIRMATVQINDDPVTPEFIPLPYRRDGAGVGADLSYWFTIIGRDTLYINIPPSSHIEDRQVYIYMDGAAVPITEGSSEVSLPPKYHELLKVGTLKRIAAARKDVIMRNNYDTERLELMAEMAWTAVISEPDFVQPVSSIPARKYHGVPTNGW